MEFKQLTALLATSAMLSASAFAASDNNIYGSTLHPLSHPTKLHPPTDITVINATNSYFYAVVPNSPINDLINPGFNDHIYNYDDRIWDTYVVLQDSYRNTFYANSVCRLAIVTVYGYPGNYRINLDSDLCT